MTRLLVIFTTVAIVAIGAATRAADAPSPCSATVERSAQLNASLLFDAVTPCAGEKRPFEATLLLVEGQIRAMADMELLPAKSDGDKLVAAQLHGRIFYQTGGAGDPELYRDPTLTQKLFERIEVWVPILPADYDPGWHYAKRPSDSKYAESVQYQKSYRLAQLRWYASLVRNDEYYAAEMELAEIQKRNPRGIVIGSADGARSQELSQTMNRVVTSVGQPQLPKPKPFEYTADPDATFSKPSRASMARKIPRSPSFGARRRLKPIGSAPPCRPRSSRRSWRKRRSIRRCWWRLPWVNARQRPVAST